MGTNEAGRAIAKGLAIVARAAIADLREAEIDTAHLETVAEAYEQAAR